MSNGRPLSILVLFKPSDSGRLSSPCMRISHRVCTEPGLAKRPIRICLSFFHPSFFAKTCERLVSACRQSFRFRAKFYHEVHVQDGGHA